MTSIDPSGGPLTARTATLARPLLGATLPFALPIGLSAFLLFSVEPLVGRLVLPVFGGTPAVWATVLFFFQGVLLVGYLYGHLSVTRLGTLGAAPPPAAGGARGRRAGRRPGPARRPSRSTPSRPSSTSSGSCSWSSACRPSCSRPRPRS